MLFLLSSCTYFMEKRPLSFEGLPLKDNEQLNYCPTSPQSSIVSSNPYAAQIFYQFLKKENDKNPKLKFIDKAVMWSLFQLNIRPDATSVYSGLQLIYKINDETFYWSFKGQRNQNHNTTYFSALKELLKKHRSQFSLTELARLMDQKLPSMIPIGPSFSSFLADNSKKLKTFHSFKRAYFKATQILNPRESIPKLLFEKLVRSHSTANQESLQKVDHMFKSKRDPALRCSFDINAYDHSIFIVSPEQLGRHNNFGISEGHKNTFLAVSHYRPKIQPYQSSYLFKGQAIDHQSALCHYQKKDQEIYLLSGKGRDPGQFIYQLFQNKLDLIQRIQNIDQVSRRARLLKLYSPERILIESHRAQKQLTQALHLSNKPIYHASNLGELTFWATLQSTHSFVTDSRSSTIPLCHN